MRDARSLRLPLLAALVLAAMPVHAHAIFGSAAPFWSGALHFLVAPLALAAVAGCIVALAGIAERDAFHAMMVAGAGAFVGAEWSQAPPLLVPLGVAMVGLVAASGSMPSRWAACALAAVAGACAGAAVAADTQDWGGSLGAALAMLVLASWGVAALMHLQRRGGFAAAGGWLRITVLARRVIGAWIAAIALLVAALGWVAGPP